MFPSSFLKFHFHLLPTTQQWHIPLQGGTFLMTLESSIPHLNCNTDHYQCHSGNLRRFWWTYIWMRMKLTHSILLWSPTMQALIWGKTMVNITEVPPLSDDVISRLWNKFISSHYDPPPTQETLDYGDKGSLFSWFYYAIFQI